MNPVEASVIEILKIVIMGPVTVLVGAYALKLHRELRGIETKRVEEVRAAEDKRVADLQAYQSKLESLVERFYQLMMKQGESLEAFDAVIRDHTKEFTQLRECINKLERAAEMAHRDATSRGGR